MKKEEKTKVCKHCKEQIPKKAKICPHCGKKQKSKKWILIAVIIVLLLICLYNCGGSDTTLDEGNVSDSVATFEGDVGSWIEQNVGASISDKDIEAIRETSQDTFDNEWRKCLSDELEIFLSIDYDAAFAKSVEQYASLYRKIWGDNIESVSAELQLISDISDGNELINNFKSQGNGFIGRMVEYGEFYVQGELPNSYTDNILGKIQKEIDSYIPSDGKNWTCYNIEYILGTAHPGDTVYIIHSESENPFTNRAGAYSLAYIDIGETIELKDSNGFVFDAPIYELVEDADALDQLSYEYYTEIENQYQRAYDLSVLLNQEK